MNKLEAAETMRHLPNQVRDSAIEVSANVLDLRPRLAQRRKQNELAKRYKYAWSWARGRSA